MADPAYKAGVAQRSRRRSNPVLHACRPGRYLKSLCDVWIGPIARDPITGREATFSADHPRSCVACIRALVADQPSPPPVDVIEPLPGLQLARCPYTPMVGRRCGQALDHEGPHRLVSDRHWTG